MKGQMKTDQGREIHSASTQVNSRAREKAAKNKSKKFSKPTKTTIIATRKGLNSSFFRQEPEDVVQSEGVL